MSCSQGYGSTAAVGQTAAVPEAVSARLDSRGGAPRSRCQSLHRPQLAQWPHGAPQGRHSRRFVPPLDPLTTRVISPRFLSETERIEIADRRQTGETIRAIAAAIKRSPSTVSRAPRRNSTRAGRYHPFEAHRAAAVRRRRRRPTILSAHPELLARVKELLAQRWSLSQISRALRREFPDRPDWHLAAETIYQELY